MFEVSRMKSEGSKTSIYLCVSSSSFACVPSVYHLVYRWSVDCAFVCAPGSVHSAVASGRTGELPVETRVGARHEGRRRNAARTHPLRIRVIERLQTTSRFISYMTMMVQLDVGYVTQVRQVTGKSHVFTTVALLEFRPKPFGFRRL